MSDSQNNKSDSQPEESPLMGLALGIVFLLGGLYMIFAFSSFFIFLIGFGCALLGAAALAGTIAESGFGDDLRIPANLRQSLPSPEKEREILRAVKDSGHGGVSPTEAAIATSLTAREADEILSELAGRGYLAVESENGILFYSIPKRGPRDTT
ncbi:MAG: hypothetical protein H0U65_04700 [Rubrobacter sp.]|nr:hypothetical protein [Rubrobacter sp.]